MTAVSGRQRGVAALQAIVEGRRLGEGEGTRATFSVAAEEALLRLRSRPGRRPWRWTVDLIRTGRILSDECALACESSIQGDAERIRLRLTTPGVDLGELDFRDLLAAGLGGDSGPEPSDERGDAIKDMAKAMARARACLGAAINAALAADPLEVELIGRRGGRRWSRREAALGQPDPYLLTRSPAGDQSANELDFVFVRPRSSLISRMASWLAGGSDPLRELATLWSEVLWLEGAQALDPAALGRGFSLVDGRPGVPVTLGTHGQWASVPGAGALWLIRDGVRVATLDSALVASGLEPTRVHGWVESPRLRRAIDDDSVARDGNFELLVAWLEDAVRHLDRASGHVLFEPLPDVIPLASGVGARRDVLTLKAMRGQEVLVAWPWEASRVPVSLQPRVALLWPSQLDEWRRQLPVGTPLVPLRALGMVPNVPPIDLHALSQGCFDPLPMLTAAHVADAGSLNVDVVAYIHRHPSARQGRMVVVAFDRQVASLDDPAQAVAGLTLLCRVHPSDGRSLEELRGDVPALEDVSRRCRALLDEQRDALVRHVVAQVADAAPPRQTSEYPPLLFDAVERLSAPTLALRFELDESIGLRLGWNDDPLLALRVGTTSDGRAATMAMLLGAVRDLGWLDVIDDELAATPHARIAFAIAPGLRHVVARVIAPPLWWWGHGREPVGFDPRQAESPRALLRSRAELVADLEGAQGPDERARERLLAHCLAARALGDDERGLAQLPLLLSYEPRALAPTRLISLDAALAHKPKPGLIPIGTGSRSLPAVAVECAPAIARLLAQATGLTPAASEAPISTSPSSTATSFLRRRTRPALVIHRFADPLAVGSLRIEPDGSSEGIALWSEGLRVGQLRLPEPLGRISGRLWVPPGAAPDAIEAVASREAARLFAQLVVQAPLLPPGGDLRRRHKAMLEWGEQLVASGGAATHPALSVLASTLSLADRAPAIAAIDAGEDLEAALDRSLRAWPLRPPRGRPSGWLGDLLGQSVGMNLVLETAVFSWRLLRVVDAQGRSARVELGLRNAWVHSAIAAEGREDLVRIWAALPLLVHEFHDGTAALGGHVPSRIERHVALWRALALRFVVG